MGHTARCSLRALPSFIFITPMFLHIVLLTGVSLAATSAFVTRSLDCACWVVLALLLLGVSLMVYTGLMRQVLSC